MTDHLYEIWEWILDQRLHTLEDKQQAFELTSTHFKDKFESNEIRQYLLEREFFDNKE